MAHGTQNATCLLKAAQSVSRAKIAVKVRKEKDTKTSVDNVETVKRSPLTPPIHPFTYEMMCFISGTDESRELVRYVEGRYIIDKQAQASSHFRFVYGHTSRYPGKRIIPPNTRNAFPPHAPGPPLWDPLEHAW